MQHSFDLQEWAEHVPVIKDGLHKRLLEKAFSEATVQRPVFPKKSEVFAALKITSFNRIKVVVVGQDPYFNEFPGVGPQAHGLSFSVRKGTPHPPSLKNIFKEINSSLYSGQMTSSDGDLTRWAKQGVLLLNASLTVEKKRPNSHAKLGWQKLTDDIIKAISQQKESVVFMLWGKFAEKKVALINQDKHLVLITTHPSPLSAHRGFLGSNVFVHCNEYLEQTAQQPIKW